MTTSSERSGRGRQVVRFLLLSALLGSAGSCGNLTAGGIGEAVVVVSGDSPEALAAAVVTGVPSSVLAFPQPAALASGGPAASDHDDDQPEGQLEAEMLLFLVAEGGELIPLSDDEVEVSVDLEGVEQDETLPRELAAGRYTGLRIVFLQIEVQVDAGLIIGGEPITGPIDIELESDSLAVTKPLNLSIDDQESVEILIDLNAASWLQAVDPSTSTVDATVFAELIAVVVR
jgi:hypothetical protein